MNIKISKTPPIERSKILKILKGILTDEISKITFSTSEL
jgi:hypothetical protein